MLWLIAANIGAKLEAWQGHIIASAKCAAMDTRPAGEIDLGRDGMGGIADSEPADGLGADGVAGSSATAQGGNMAMGE
jgi:hypothetical protein